MRLRPLVIVAASMLCFGCIDREPPFDRHSRSEFWIANAPEDVGFRTEELEAIMADVRSGRYGEIHAILVTRRGKLAYEAYFTGRDDSWGKPPKEQVTYGPHRLHDLRSITKSIVSILIGIAIDRGEIRSVDARLTELLPRYRPLLTGQKEALTLRHLLMMTPGLPHEDDFPFPGLRNPHQDATGYVLAQELVASPGDSFAYGDVPAHLAGVILETTTGRPIDDYARELLFEPLGITSYEWTYDAKGGPGAAWGLRLNPNDLAKLGVLLTQRGKWHGRQIVSQAWLAQAMAPQLSVAAAEDAPEWAVSSGYGFFWWIDRFSVAGSQVSVVTASGFGGQRLFVVPEHDLSVVVVARLSPKNSRATWYPEQILHRVLLAA